jgi:FMN phosphatase YigB (HAD superfamily)
MTNLSNAVAFFDIGNTLASVRVSATENRIEELIVFGDVPPVLRELRPKGVRLGILSDRGQVPEENVNEALERAGLLQYLDRDLILYGPKDSSRLFERACARSESKLSPARRQCRQCLLCGRHRTRDGGSGMDRLYTLTPRLGSYFVRALAAASPGFKSE